jgi:hypothetical protein
MNGCRWAGGISPVSPEAVLLTTMVFVGFNVA